MPVPGRMLLPCGSGGSIPQFNRRAGGGVYNHRKRSPLQAAQACVHPDPVFRRLHEKEFSTSQQTEPTHATSRWRDERSCTTQAYRFLLADQDPLPIFRDKKELNSVFIGRIGEPGSRTAPWGLQQPTRSSLYPGTQAPLFHPTDRRACGGCLLPARGVHHRDHPGNPGNDRNADFLSQAVSEER